ncbi:MAG TPA: phosphatase PAP2 family protein [Jatrophihabitans sp.]|nr:phosphatase PAP2 family protein [Jatrophihabitans sp.]
MITVGPSRARHPRALLATLGTFAVLLVVVVTHWSPVRELDVRVRSGLDRYGAAHPDWVRVWNGVTTVLQPNVWRAVALVVVVLLLWRGRRDTALVLAIVVVLAALAEVGLKAAVDRARPSPYPGAPHAVGPSFPSGHAMTAAAVAVALLAVAREAGLLERGWSRWLAWAAGVGVVAAVAFSRLALGVHYLSDVVGGLLLGVACALAVPVVLVNLDRRTASS